MERREPAIAYSQQKMTIEEYLAFENEASEKHEYYQGEVFAMSGANTTHNRIVVNTLVAAGQFLKGKKCQPFNSDQRVYVEKTRFLPTPIFLFSATK